MSASKDAFQMESKEKIFEWLVTKNIFSGQLGRRLLEHCAVENGSLSHSYQDGKGFGAVHENGDGLKTFGPFLQKMMESMLRDFL